jgi:hypothetical protein
MRRAADALHTGLAGNLASPACVHRFMIKQVTPAKPDYAMMMVWAAIGLGGLLIARRYGFLTGLRTVNDALGVARTVRRRPARRLRPKSVRFKTVR